MNSIVYVPNLSSEKYSHRSVNWQHLLPLVSKFDTIVLEFQHDTSFENPFSRLLENSRTLMEDLFNQHLKRKVLSPLPVRMRSGLTCKLSSGQNSL